MNSLRAVWTLLGRPRPATRRHPHTWVNATRNADVGTRELCTTCGLSRTTSAQTGPAVLVNVHPVEQCAGRPCVMHNPSDHHMRGWPTNWRGDTRVMERMCPHGIGHPDPDDVAWQKTQGRGWVAVHGCDGCC